MLLVEHDQPQLAERQEQRRARPHHRPHRAVDDAAPGAGALRRRHVGVPFGRPRAEAAGEAVEEGVGERDLGQKDQRLPPGAQRIGHRLEEHFGLAAAGDAIEQRHAETRRHRCRGSAPSAAACSALTGSAARRPDRAAATIGGGGISSRSSAPASLQPLDHRGRHPAGADDAPIFAQARPSATVSSTRSRAGVIRSGSMPVLRKARDRPLRLERLGRAQHRRAARAPGGASV